MRWPGACVSAAKEACQPDLAPPDPRLTPGRRRTPQPAAADAGPALGAGPSRCQRAPAPRGTCGDERRAGRAPTPGPVRTRATPRARRRVRGRASRPHAPHHDFRDARHRAPRSPPTPASSAPSPSRPWLPYPVLYFLILMLVLVPITLAAAPPPAYLLHAWAGLPGVCLAGRGRGVQRVSAGPPFLERPGVKRNLSRRPGGGPLISQDQRQEINGHRSTGDRAHSALSPSREGAVPSMSFAVVGRRAVPRHGEARGLWCASAWRPSGHLRRDRRVSRLSGVSGRRSQAMLEVAGAFSRDLRAASRPLDQLPARKLIPSRIAMVASAMTPPSDPGAKSVPKTCASVVWKRGNCRQRSRRWPGCAPSRWRVCSRGEG